MNELSTIPKITVPKLIPFEKTNAIKLMAASELLAARAIELVIVTDADAAKATNLGKEIRTAQKDLEAIRTEMVGPFNTVTKQINAFFKASAEKNDSSINAVSRRLAAHNAKRKAEAEAAAAAERKVQDEIAAKVAADLESAGYADVAAAVIEHQIEASAAIEPAKVDPTRTMAGNIGSVAEIPDFEIIDFSKVPDEFKEINSTAVRKAISGQNGLRNISGLRVFMKPRVSYR